MKKSLHILNGIALVATIFINYLSNSGAFNGETMSSISARYQNLFTPAGYAFSIWGLIYAGLLAFVIVEGRKYLNDNDKLLDRLGLWFIASCIANSMWVIAWLHDYTGLSVLIMILLLCCLVQIILRLNIALEEVSMQRKIFVGWPFAIYTGWITVALVANISAWLTKIDWNGWGISDTAWAIIMITIAGAVNLLFTWKRNSWAFSLTGIWALIAIAIANWDAVIPVRIAALVVAVVLLVNIILQYAITRGRQQGKLST